MAGLPHRRERAAGRAAARSLQQDAPESHRRGVVQAGCRAALRAARELGLLDTHRRRWSDQHHPRHRQSGRLRRSVYYFGGSIGV